MHAMNHTTKNILQLGCQSQTVMGEIKRKINNSSKQKRQTNHAMVEGTIK